MMKVAVGGGSRSAVAQELLWQTMSAQELAALASTATLFGGPRVFVLTGALNSDRQEEFLDLAEAFVDSPHTFIFEEQKLLKKPTDALKKAGAKIEINKTEKKEEYRFDRFGLTSALAARDKKRLWIALTKALREGEKPEALAGLLAWKARHMKEVELSRKLTFMYHDSHRGAGDLALLLEHFALTL
jgi:DNA polymerase III delta subunit